MSVPPAEPPPAAPEPGSRTSLRGPLLRFGLFAALVATGAALLLLTPAADYLERDALIQLLGRLRLAWWAPLALVAGFVLVAPSGVPISPLIFAGGAVFGPVWGWLYNLVGSLLGAVISYVLATALGKELVERLAGERRMQWIERQLERHGFSTLVGIRFLPIPFALVNYGAALAGFRFGPFMAATLLGLVPSILMWTYLYHALVSAATADARGELLRNTGLVIGLIALLMVLRPLGRFLLKREQAAADEPDGS